MTLLGRHTVRLGVAYRRATAFADTAATIRATGSIAYGLTNAVPAGAVLPHGTRAAVLKAYRSTGIAGARTRIVALGLRHIPPRSVWDITRRTIACVTASVISARIVMALRLTDAAIRDADLERPTVSARGWHAIAIAAQLSRSAATRPATAIGGSAATLALRLTPCCWGLGRRTTCDNEERHSQHQRCKEKS